MSQIIDLKILRWQKIDDCILLGRDLSMMIGNYLIYYRDLYQKGNLLELSSRLYLPNKDNHGTVLFGDYDRKSKNRQQFVACFTCQVYHAIFKHNNTCTLELLSRQNLPPCVLHGIEDPSYFYRRVNKRIKESFDEFGLGNPGEIN